MKKEITKEPNSLLIWWGKFSEKHQGIAQFITFFILCNGVTVLQMIMMVLFKWIFGFTALVNINFEMLHIGQSVDGAPYYIFNYAAGSIACGGGGGLAYFLAVQITMAIAQVINFISQRKITFKSNGNVWKAASWYVIAYVIITIGASALQGIYRTPLYRFMIQAMGNGTGTTLADIITMIINCTLSFWVFFFIMKWIFKNK